MSVFDDDGVMLVSFRLPRALERTLRERMAITLQSLSATVAGLLNEGMWIDRARLLRALPEGETVQLQVRLPRALVRQLRERLSRTGRTQNAEIVFLLASALEHEAEDGRLEAEQLAAAGVKGGR